MHVNQRQRRRLWTIDSKYFSRSNALHSRRRERLNKDADSWLKLRVKFIPAIFSQTGRNISTTRQTSSQRGVRGISGNKRRVAQMHPFYPNHSLIKSLDGPRVSATSRVIDRRQKLGYHRAAERTNRRSSCIARLMHRRCTDDAPPLQCNRVPYNG